MKKENIKNKNKTSDKQVLLIILDGWGYRKETKNNGIALAEKPNFDSLWKKYSHGFLSASGLSVGLPKGQMGNSEVGHTTIGAGKVVYTDLVRISESAKKKEFSKNPAFIKLFNHLKKNESTLHIMGLLGPGGIHSHTEHFYSFIKTAKESGVKKIFIHAFTDGRDTPPQSASGFLVELEKELSKMKVGKIVSICGRYFAMDRDNNWDRLEKANKMLFDGVGKNVQGKKASEVAKEYYKEGKTDEYFEPTIFLGENGEKNVIEKNDGIFFFNYRADRARMITKKILERNNPSTSLDKTRDKTLGVKKMNLCFVSMTQYDEKLKTEVAFAPINIETTLAKEISLAGFSQSHIAETEKFAHATYFLNGGEQKLYKKEKHILLNSRKDVPTHDLAPEMKAKEIADKTIEEIKNGTDFIFVNFANPDMVGHTANEKAIKVAIETVDRELGRIIDEVENNNAIAIITADHGNAETNIDPKTGEKHTAHTSNLVPIIIAGLKNKIKKGGLSDIAPTTLSLLGIKSPKSMSGKRLI
jgi:2,3-bisphosphoglycerate-independent phosphoglycerate mutase